MFQGKRSIFGLLLSMLLAVTLLGGYSGVGTAAGLQSNGEPLVTLSVDLPVYSAAQSVVVHVTITNPTGHTLKVLKWYTPAEDFEEALFTVSVDGAPAAYLGPIYKRPAPTGSDYISLKAGESLIRDVDLAAYYDLSASGTYSVTYATASPALFSEKGGSALKQADRLDSNTITFVAEGRLSSSLAAQIAPQAVTGATSFNKCTTAQQSTLMNARSQASTYASGALSYLSTGKQGSRYVTWFGVFDAARYATVTSHFSALKNAMDTAAVTFDCSCKKSYYAYVYPTKPYVIYPCKVFWTAPLSGTDSQGGTLIHEMSHFNVVASTDDYVYGQSGAKSLAISNPTQAIDNADNHEYFAENNPSLP